MRIRRGATRSTMAPTSLLGRDEDGQPRAGRVAPDSRAASASYALKKLLGSTTVRGDVWMVFEARCVPCVTSFVAVVRPKES